ncbi:polyprenyl synthetase, partial [Opisthorchis viverrini]
MEACSLPSCSAGVGTMDANRWIQLHKEFDAYYSEFERLLSECARPKNSADELVQLHAGFLIHDDIIDNSPTRRNRTSWFLMQKQAGRGLIAVNDGLHLILTTKFLLHRLFVRNGTTAVGYLKLLQLFDEVSYRTCWGESLDSHYSRTAPNDNTTELLPLDSFTRSNFNEICTWKTGFYTFYLPVACGMAIAGTTDEASYSAASHILLKLGRYFQAQDDYLDCFGDVAVTGKVGTDIADGKCSWPIVECLARASPEQIKVIQQNYGRRDPVAQSAVREVYEQLRLRQIFADYEAQMRTEIMGDITDWTLPDACVTRHAQHLFCDLVDLLFRRAK